MHYRSALWQMARADTWMSARRRRSVDTVQAKGVAAAQAGERV